MRIYHLVLALCTASLSQAADISLPRLPFDGERAKALQEEWARGYGLDASMTNSIGIKLVLIPGGRFRDRRAKLRH